MKNSMVRVTSFSKLSALLLLQEKPRTGYELIKLMRIRFNQPSSPGQVYPFLSLLQRRGLIVVKSSGAREKKTYTLTLTGKQFCSQMLSDVEGLVEMAILPRVNKCAHCGCKVLGKGHVEKKKGKTLHFCCEPCAQQKSG